MIDYIVFEKKADEHLPAWSLDLVKDFCEDQKHEVASYEDSAVFIVAKLVSASDDCEKKYRHLELTPTVSFLIRDDPSLDEFLQPEIAIPLEHPMTFARREQVCIEEIIRETHIRETHIRETHRGDRGDGDSKEEEPYYYA